MLYRKGSKTETKNSDCIGIITLGENMKNQKTLKLLLNALPNYVSTKEPLTERTPAIEALLEAAGDGWRKEKCPNRIKPYCGRGTIHRKTIFRELREPTINDNPDILDKLMYGKDAKGPWAKTYDLDLCECRKCGAVWLETHFSTHSGTKPGESIPMPWEEIGVDVS